MVVFILTLYGDIASHFTLPASYTSSDNKVARRYLFDFSLCDCTGGGIAAQIAGLAHLRDFILSYLRRVSLTLNRSHLAGLI